MLVGCVGYGQTPATGKPAAASAKDSEPGLAILSDTKGVDFSRYLGRLHNDIMGNWAQATFPEVPGEVAIRVTILSDGKIANMRIETTSGNAGLDKAAWKTIVNEGQFPALPSQFHGPQIDVRMIFTCKGPSYVTPNATNSPH